jgi:hypothetical protein
MCEPATLTAIGTAAASAASSAAAGAAAAGSAVAAAASSTAFLTAATVASGAIGAYGAVRQGQAQKQQADYQSAVERNNATIAGWQAEDATQRGRVEEQRQRLHAARIAGAQRAGYASSGVELTSGSPLDTLMDTASLGELDALTIRSNAEREAYGFRSQQGNLTAQGGLTRMAGRNAATAGTISAAGTLLSSGATYADRRLTYERLGIR